MTIPQPRLLPDALASDEAPTVIAAAIEHCQSLVSGRKVAHGRKVWARAELKRLKREGK